MEETTLELLRWIVSSSAESGRLPTEAAIRDRLGGEPWHLDDLLRTGLVQAMDTVIAPTLKGLEADGTPAASDLLAACREAHAKLREEYVNRPGQVVMAQDLATHLAWKVPRTSLVIACLVGAPGLSTLSWNGVFLVGITPDRRILESDPFVAEPEETSRTTDHPLTLTVRDFRVLSQVDWSPDGVCVLAGPNGSGKTSLLQALAFLSDAFRMGLPDAIRLQLGATALHRLAAGNQEIVLGVAVGDLAWELRLPMDGASAAEFPGETVRVGDAIRIRRASWASDWYLGKERRVVTEKGRTCLRAAWDAGQSAWLEPLVELLRSYRMYARYNLEILRRGGTGSESDEVLDADGQNLFAVLRNWTAAPRRFENRFQWVLGELVKAFPGLIQELETDPPVGPTVPVRFFPPGSSKALPIHRASDGLLIGLLHLVAVAGARPGSIVAIDEMENQLHPYAIRSILGSMREIAEERRLTVLLATHSPVVMNRFNAEPDHFFVMEPGRPSLPVALDQLHDPDWLAHFSIGDLYERLEFGAPIARKSA